jgi:hypothetical protein
MGFKPKLVIVHEINMVTKEITEKRTLEENFVFSTSLYD